MFIESDKNDVFEKIYSTYSASTHTRTWWQFIQLNLIENNITNLI